MIPFLMGERVGPLNGFQILGLEPVNGFFLYWRISLKVTSYKKLN